MSVHNFCRVNGCRKNLSRQYFICYPHMQLVPPAMLEPVEAAVQLLNGPRPTQEPSEENQALLLKWVEALAAYKKGKREIINYVDNLLMEQQREKSS